MAQMPGVAGRTFKITLISMLKDLVEKTDNIQIANFSNEMEIPISIKYNWTTFKKKNTVSEGKSYFYNLISKLSTAEEGVSEVEDK